MVGMLAESWESPDPKTCIYHLRQGVHFHNTPPVNGREMTADDVVGTWKLHIVQTRSPHYINPTTPPESRITCTKIDKYTVRFDFPNPNVSPWTWVRSAFAIVPPEMYTTYGDLLDWKRECGTGPYTIVDSVTDSSITYKRFSSYWMIDPFFPQNKLPYMDKVVLLIIRDNSTMLAALRTHKIDHVSALTWEQGEDMMKTNPELKYRKILSTTTPVIQFREELAGAPWGNQKVRQALQMATDSNAILSGYLKGNGVILTWPYMPNCVGVYKPLEEQSAEVKALFTYNPDGAKKLLTEAGYPNGIKAKISLFSDPTYTDLMAIVKEQWAKINVTVDFEIMDYGALTTAMVNHTFNDMSLIYWGNIGPTSAPAWAYRSKILYNYSAVNDPYIDEQANAALNTSSLDTQYQILRDLGPYLLKRCDYLPLPTPYLYTFWAPWIKQYSGEYIVGKYYNYRTPFIYGWMDQALKTQITGKK
jgi:peptide/nickel transport system substrate-binding protein